uniref:BUD31 homolog n=1 Tax=Hucho hucho TaxID=62062 RepID=A0A4W5L5Z1_9TELE
MPKVKRSRKPPPDGWELIEPTLDELDQKMREAETEPHEGKRKVESLWPIFRLHHQRSRYIFDLFYKRKAISRVKPKGRWFRIPESRLGGKSVLVTLSKLTKPLIALVSRSGQEHQLHDYNVNVIQRTVVNGNQLLQ